jgi:hypothetical protein
VARKDESARAKRDALRKAGVTAPDTFPEFLAELAELPAPGFRDTVVTMDDRRPSILSTREVVDLDEIPVFVKNKKLVNSDVTFAQKVIEALIGKKVKSATTAAFAEAVFSLLIDHGGHVSGAVNTMVTARAGKDLVSSLAAEEISRRPPGSARRGAFGICRTSQEAPVLRLRSRGRERDDGEERLAHSERRRRHVGAFP